MTTLQFQKTILGWYKINKRSLPWRRTKNPYKILVSEMMLQQTQISRVLPKYKEFLKEFPSLKALAKAPKSKLLKTWHGLGYWRRALYLQETAKIIEKEYQGKFPKDPKVLETLPGIGPYTARALACFAFNGKEAFIDTNIRRIYLHFFFPRKNVVSDKQILTVAQKAVLKNNPREWHYALFDYGAEVLKDKTINKRSKHYAKQSIFEGSFRSFRTKAVQFLLKQRGNKSTHKTLESLLKKELARQKSSYSAQEVIESLLRDKLVRKTKIRYYL